MTRKHRFFVLLLAVLIFCMPAIALANSAEPPGLIVAVANAPDDLALFIRFDDGQVPLRAQKKAWVTYYRFHYYDMIEAGISGDKSVEGATLLVQVEGGEAEYALPDESFSRYNNLVELDIKRGTLRLDQNPWRVPMLVVLRVVLTLLIEGAVFFLFGYRNRRTWVAFFICNLLTQTALNAMITGPELGYWFLVYAFMEILIFISESAALGIVVKEKKWGVTVLCTLLANALSLVLGGVLISYLPV